MGIRSLKFEMRGTVGQTADFGCLIVDFNQDPNLDKWHKTKKGQDNAETRKPETLTRPISFTFPRVVEDDLREFGGELVAGF